MIQLRQYQTEAKLSVFNYFSLKQGHPLVAMPTGTGKSLVIGSLIRDILESWPNQRIMALTHVKELIRQNSDKLKDIWPAAPYGIYSVGLKQRDTQLPILFGGVASVVNNIAEFGHRDLLLIDEAHLLSPNADSMYHRIIAGLQAINPYLKVIGFTATPYRVGQGLLTADGLFTDICFDITGMQPFNRLIAEGFLAPLISKRTATQLDVSKVHIGADGDFAKGELEKAVDTSDLIYQVCKEMVEYFWNRNCWLIFASGISHANHVADMLRSFGIPTVAVHSKMGDDNRDRAIEDFKNGKLRCLVNNNVLTTGFDFPAIDAIGMLRPTCSTGLWVQMLGRGTRPSADTMKQNCLVLDFAGNTVRLGPINDPVIPRPKGSGAPGVAPIKICDNCGVYNHANARVCEACGYEFPQHVALANTASTAELLRSDLPQLEWFDVKQALYMKYIPSSRIPLLKATYICTDPANVIVSKSFDSVVCLENPGYAGVSAKNWWKKMMGSAEAPPNVDEALKWVSGLKVPRRIQVEVNRKYPQIMAMEF